LVVIGIHTAKFDTERNAENIREAILRYGIRHPVINDADHQIWDTFDVHAWPTLLLIDPEGYAVWGASGEVPLEELDRLLRRAIPYYREKKLLDETPLRFDLLARRQRAGPLRFPGKVLVDEKGERLFIADSGHHRIVVCRPDGTLIEVIGTGRRGRKDGPFALAEFNDPQGMALEGDVLYVADNRNHLIRKVDLATGLVSTIAGTGKQNRPSAIFDAAPAGRQALASPWALQVADGYIYIAMAGAHQIWRLSLHQMEVALYAGNGREDIVDGRLLPKWPYGLGGCSFAQPSGLASDGRFLYVADSEGSSIRRVPLNGSGDVTTLVGTAHLPVARLFTFGDVDGPGTRARLQHPLGITYYQGRLYVADTYNDKIKVVDPDSGYTRSLPLRGEEHVEQQLLLNEPGGISAGFGKLFIADTNNHRVCVVDLDRQYRLVELAIRGLKPPQQQAERAASFVPPEASQYRLEPVQAWPEAGKVLLQVALELPPGWKINVQAPMSYRVKVAPVDASFEPLAAQVQVFPSKLVRPPADRPSIEVPISGDYTRCLVTVVLHYYMCREGAEGLCRPDSAAWVIPLELRPDAAGATIALQHAVH